MSEGRKLEPEKYTDRLRSAAHVLLTDQDPRQQSSKLAAEQMYRELRKLLPLARSGQLLREAIWVGRNLFDFDDDRASRQRDHIIRSAVSKPMSRELVKYQKDGGRAH